jgi:hypothetical protein
MSGSLPIIHEEPHPPVAPSPQAGRVGEGFFYYGCLTGHDIIRKDVAQNSLIKSSGQRIVQFGRCLMRCVTCKLTAAGLFCHALV